MSLDRSRVTAEIEVWGTIVWVDSYGPDLFALEAGIAELRDYYDYIDIVFSTYKSGSEVSQIRRGELKIESANEDRQYVWQECLAAREITDGAFDPWCVEGGFDPSGYVKGWAADRGVEIMKRHGATNVQINAAGDISLTGGFDGGPWSIGIRHPEDAHTIVKVIELVDGAIATSGTYEQGAHIRDPHTGLIAIGARSATVVGPDGGLAEAIATALIVEGRDGARWFQKPELKGYYAWVIDRHEDTSWEIASDSFAP